MFRRFRLGLFPLAHECSCKRLRTEDYTRSLVKNRDFGLCGEFILNGIVSVLYLAVRAELACK